MPTPEGVEIVIRNEDDAWRVLSDALAGKYEDLEDMDLRLDGWPRLKLKIDFPGPIITPSMMRGIVELQASVYRSYAIIRYESPNANKLTKEEKEALEFKVEVTEGSSLSDIIGEKAFQEIVNSLIDKMDPVHIIITVVGVALIFVSGSVIRAYLQERTEQRKGELAAGERRDMLEHLKFMSKQESDRMKLLANAMQEEPVLSQIDEVAESARHEILKRTPEDQELEIAGAAVDGKVARELVKNARKKAEEIEFDGEFVILRVDTTAPDGFRVKLKSVDDELALTASVQDIMISQKQRKIIQDAEWAKVPVKVTIQAKQRGEYIVEAVIIDAEKID